MKAHHEESRDHSKKSHRRQNHKNCIRRYATAFIGIAIVIVLCIHWHLAILHTRGLQPHDLFLSSFSSSRLGTNGQPAGEPRPLEAAPRDDVAPYILSPICGGCTRSFFDHRHCFTILQRDEKKSGGKLTLLDAASKLGRESKTCELCDPVQCWKHYFNNSTQNYGSGHQSKYWRFDRSHPKFVNPTTFSLTSIPSELRIPPSRFQDMGAYFREKYEFSKANNASMDYLVEYNPGLVAIPSKMKQFLPKEAAYLLSLRVTPANNCFSSEVYANLPKDVWSAVYHTSTNNLGLALLDQNYQMIPGYDVVIEIAVPLDLKRSMTSKRTGKNVEDVSPTFMDYRIFVLNNEIYLHANADTVSVNRLSLRAKGFGDDDAYLKNTGTCVAVAEEAGEQGNWEKPCRFDNLYGGDNLQVTLMRQFNTIWSGGIYGKNYALFGLPNATHPDAPDSIYAEIHIFPHHVQQILPEEYDKLAKKKVFEYIWKEGTHKSRHFKIDRVNMRSVKEVGNATESDNVPLPSFSSIDAHEDWFPGQEAPFKEAAHGGACCVSFSADELNLGGTKNNHHESLLVGIGHTKVTWKPFYSKAHVPQEKKDRIPHTHYVSLFYAFDPYPPFHIRARSGYFCLGHAPLANGNELPPTEGGIFNPHSILTRNRNLQQNNITFDCPQMSFVSSYIEKVGDASKTIIGYGLNDCTGRLVEVEKREIARLLYPDPMDMIFEPT
mmetsp:Transcript_24233/g.52273  ORF Transcript_24233/g.52273 Transcript_24233/m.52273 type:complete len:719 (-) Transcript_24233:206-2362(-)